MTEIQFDRPTTIDETVQILAEGDALLLGGGTALMFLVKQHLVAPTHLIWIGDVDGMHQIDATGSMTTVGAGVTLADLATSRVIRERHPMIADAAEAVGNPRVRAVATVGGAIVHADPRQDLLPALLAADATVHIAGGDQPRSVRLRDGFFEAFMSVSISDQELVTTVDLPHRPGAVQRYVRFTPDSPDDYPTVAVAVDLNWDHGELGNVSLGLGGVAETPLSIEGLDDVLTTTPNLATVAAAAEYAMDATSPIDDAQGSARYKRSMTRVWVERVLKDALALTVDGEREDRR